MIAGLSFRAVLDTGNSTHRSFPVLLLSFHAIHEVVLKDLRKKPVELHFQTMQFTEFRKGYKIYFCLENVSKN